MTHELLKEHTTNEGQSNKLVLVDFWAEWCGPCKVMAPVLDAFERDNPDVILTKVNVDEQQTVAAKYGIWSIPTLIVFKEGEEVSRIVGAVSQRTLEQKIAEVR